MDNLSSGLDVGSTCFSVSEFRTGGTGGQQRRQQYLNVRLSGLMGICQGKVLKISFRQYTVQIKMMMNILMGSSTCVKHNKHGTLTWMKNLIHHGLMHWIKV